MPIHSFDGKTPKLGRGVWLAPSAVITGDMDIGDDVSFWFHTVARGDVHWMRIGEGTNIQDGTVLHVSHGTHPLDIGKGVVVGHSAVLHGCTVEDNALIGIGARVLDGAVIGTGAQVAAGAVVSPGTVIPPGQMAMGVPARVKRPLSDGEKDGILEIRDRYKHLKEVYRKELGDGF